MSRANTKLVRQIVAKYYTAYASYNDVRKDKKTRRIKFMRTGFKHHVDEYKAWAAGIKKDLVAAGIWHRDEGFKESYCNRGEYVYYSVVIEA